VRLILSGSGRKLLPASFVAGADGRLGVAVPISRRASGAGDHIVSGAGRPIARVDCLDAGASSRSWSSESTEYRAGTGVLTPRHGRSRQSSGIAGTPFASPITTQARARLCAIRA